MLKSHLLLLANFIDNSAVSHVFDTAWKILLILGTIVVILLKVPNLFDRFFKGIETMGSKMNKLIYGKYNLKDFFDQDFMNAKNPCVSTWVCAT